MIRQISFFIIGAIVAVILILSTHIYSALFTAASSENVKMVIVIEKGESLPSIMKNLTGAGLIKSETGFKLLSRLGGAHRNIKAGEYELSTAMTPIEILRALREGKVKYHFVTIPEGYRIEDIALLLEEAGLADAAEFRSASLKEGAAAAYGLNGPVGSRWPALEGFLFPDTYSFAKPIKIQDILSAMTGRFKEVYAGEVESGAEGLGLSMLEAVTLASIIEKETGRREEMRTISAVFHNRLKRGIALQSDPTVIYGIKDFDGNIRKKDLRKDTPYNTYKRRGLPPGPIASPGRESLNAAVNPTDEKYLYFVSRNDGTHHFSSTLKEHNKAVRTYQKRGRRGRTK